MEVILLEKIANLGNLGDKVTIKSGYGRNFLIPKGNKYRGQNVEYLLRMPVGQKVRIKESQRRDSNNDFWAEDFDDYFDDNEQEKLTYTTWVMTEKGIQLDGKKKVKKTEQE